MSNVIKFPVIAGIEITTDEYGRFNLNALHRASGGEKRKGPSYWLNSEGTTALIEALERKLTDTGFPVSPISVKKGGRRQGTFVHELLAVSYAGWIGPEFQLEVNQTFIDYKTGKLQHADPVLPNFTDPAEAAVAWAHEFKEKQTAKLERDDAIRTKAEIGSRREATAMAKASAEGRRATALERELGINRDWKQVKAVDWLSQVFDLPNRVAYAQIGKKLASISREMNLEPRQVEDIEFGHVKAYHVDVINEFKKRVFMDSSLLAKYRKKQEAA
ncbi:KilA-N domain-containing protein [Marinobacterium stanieri]|uniref:KilA-N domain-containing protein n=1 Tax=Marinobacterium stanieri TaxID=49186 RepID=UPI000255A5FB|nr:KilA-N domain-containing protein [Marinobacterium stanieri]